MRRPQRLLAALLLLASAFAFGCGGDVASTPDAATSGNGAHPSTEDAMGTSAAGSDAGDAGAPSAGSGTSADASSPAEDSAHDDASDGGVTPIPWDGRAPLAHRASGTACSRGRDGGVVPSCPDSGAGPLPGNPCAVDSDCTGGSDGVCICEPAFMSPPSGSGPGPVYSKTYCSYDACFVDSDCAAHVPCECREPNIAGNPNVCLSASNCAVDSDCAQPAFCSPSAVFGQTPDIGFFCHTSNDICIDDSDCPSPDGPTTEECRFDATSATWRCFEVPIRL